MTPMASIVSKVPDDAVSDRPLIYISGVRNDYRLRTRIEYQALRLYDASPDVWEDTKLSLGGGWTQEVDAAIQRARVAVVLLSEGYLNSPYGERELSQLEERSRKSGLAIFPILQERCEWQRFDVLRRSRVWESKLPLSELAPEEVEEELRRIVDEILQLAGFTLVGVPASLVPRFRFSGSAAAVVAEAARLAGRSGRKAVNCSCLLFGLAEQAPKSRNTARFVRQALDGKGEYNAAFEQFLQDANARTVGRPVEGLASHLTPNTIAVLTSAEKIAFEVGPGSKEIHARHVFGALIGPQPPKNSAKKRISGAGIELSELILQFLAFLKESVPLENQARWREILLPSPPDSSGSESPVEESSVEEVEVEPPGSQEKVIPEPSHSSYISGAPGYNSEFCGVGGSGTVSDHLGVEGLAGRLAELICLQETRLPLAIGLFANWGSGKSHFMNLIDRRMKLLALEARETADSQSRWCSEIVPIYFNAWHYSDSNLWASLVTEVFDALFARIEPQKDELALLGDRLKRAGGVSSLAEEQLKIANDGVLKASIVLESAIADKKRAGQTFRAMLEGLKSLIPELETEQNSERVRELLGVSAEDATLSDLNKKRKELTSIAGRVKAFWLRAINPEGLATRLVWLAGAAIGISIIYFVSLHVEWVKQLLEWMGPWVRKALMGLAFVSVWMTPVFRQVQAGLSQLEKWQKRAEQAQKSMPAEQRVVEARNEKSEADAKANAAKVALDAAKSEEQSLKKAIESLSPDRRLGRFIETRARSADYRGQLGLVSLARRDFDELSKIFTDAESLKREMKDKPQEAEGLERLSLRVDRVVLFIDDLDRCEPEKIVDVLQAVHLLLAYPLFAVVVGVDQRALRQSLRMRFQGLLAKNGDEMAASQIPNGAVHEAPATPLDYLEKIFHIPFHLPPMDKMGFESLVWNLTQPKERLADSDQVRDNGKATVSASSVSSTPMDGISDAEPRTEQDFVDEQEPDKSPDESGPKFRRLVGSVPLCDWERNALKDYHSLIRTPRGATRFLNTYRLVRAGVPSTDWDVFRGDEGGLGEFRIPMVLLAVAAGQPSIARDWFKLVWQSAGSELPESDGMTDGNKVAWTEFRRLFKESEKQMQMQLTRDLVTNWIGRVERFTF